MQNYITMNSTKIKQPDSGLGYNFETTYSEDSVRVQSGVLHVSPMFTVEGFTYTASQLTADEMKTILKIIATGKPFELHYLSAYYGEWRDDSFYVAKGSLSVGSWKADEERYDSLSFNMIGVNPL